MQSQALKRQKTKVNNPDLAKSLRILQKFFCNSSIYLAVKIEISDNVLFPDKIPCSDMFQHFFTWETFCKKFPKPFKKLYTTYQI